MGHSQLWGPAGDRLLIAGLTGGIASGKSEVDRELERLGATVIDADEVARSVVEPGKPAHSAVAEAFGRDVLDRSGRIDRAALAEVVFSDEGRRRTLNAITHPAIFLEMKRRVSAYADRLMADDVPAVVIDAALIVDAGMSDMFDILVVVTADENARVARMVGNRGMSEEEARARIASQVPDRKRAELSDFEIPNDGSLEELHEKVREVWSEISRRAAESYS